MNEKLGARSRVSLEVTKWQVQTMLRDMKLHLRQMTKGFKVEDDLARCLEKLEESTTTLINIYDRIQDYQEHQNLANYIAIISTTSRHDHRELKLEMLIRSNLIIKQYQMAINALKQWVFPFANEYLRTIPSHLEIQTNQTSKEIKSVLEKVEKKQLSTQQEDALKHVGVYFDSHHVSSHPFFVWKNNQHKNSITNCQGKPPHLVQTSGQVHKAKML